MEGGERKRDSPSLTPAVAAGEQGGVARTYREDEMTSATDLAARRESVVDDYDAICRTVQLCLDGEATGDADKLREAFHEDARIFGSLAGERFDGHISILIDLAATAPADTGSYRSRILSVQQVGDVAVVTVAEEGYWGAVSFIDQLSLARLNDRWRIVTKLFTHTGGEPPDLG